MKKIQTTCAVVTLLASPLIAKTPIGGLTVAVTQDGSKVIAGGDTRTLIVLDPDSLEVKNKIWIGTSIVGLNFNQDGSVLAVSDTSDAILLYSTADWKLIKQLKIAVPSFAPEAGLVAGVGGGYKDKKVVVFSLKDGQAKGSIPLPEKARVSSLAIKGDGSKVAVLLYEKEDKSEKKVNYSDIPKELKGFARSEFQQKNDGKTSQFLIYDLATKKATTDTKTFYTNNNGALKYHKDGLAYVGYNNLNAKISDSGEFSLFQLKGSYNYGFGWSWDGSHVMAGGLRNFSHTPSGTLTTTTTGDCNKLPGWPEYWKGFAGTTGGKNFYGATSGYRVFKFGPDGKILKTGQGF